MGFELPRVSRCCFCVSLRTGSLIIGYLSLIGAILAIASICFLTYLVAALGEKEDNTPEGTTGDEAQQSIILYIVFGCRLLLFIVYFVFSLLLLIGIYKNKPKYMRYYFIAGMVILALNLVFVIIGFASAGFSSTAPHLVNCAFMFYFLLVVRSTYLDMEEQKPAPPVNAMHY